MKAAIKRDDSTPARDVARQLQTTLDSFRSAVSEEKHVGISGRNLAKFVSKPKRRLRSEHPERSMNHSLHLRSRCRNYARMVVAGIAGAEAGDEVQISATVMTKDINSFRTFYR